MVEGGSITVTLAPPDIVNGRTSQEQGKKEAND